MSNKKQTTFMGDEISNKYKFTVNKNKNAKFINNTESGINTVIAEEYLVDEFVKVVTKTYRDSGSDDSDVVLNEYITSETNTTFVLMVGEYAFKVKYSPARKKTINKFIKSAYVSSLVKYTAGVDTNYPIDIFNNGTASIMVKLVRDNRSNKCAKFYLSDVDTIFHKDDGTNNSSSGSDNDEATPTTAAAVDVTNNIPNELPLLIRRAFALLCNLYIDSIVDADNRLIISCTKRIRGFLCDSFNSVKYNEILATMYAADIEDTGKPIPINKISTSYEEQKKCNSCDEVVIKSFYNTFNKSVNGENFLYVESFTKNPTDNPYSYYDVSATLDQSKSICNSTFDLMNELMIFICKTTEKILTKAEVVHRDLHQGNIIYNVETKNFTIIDWDRAEILNKGGSFELTNPFIKDTIRTEFIFFTKSMFIKSSNQCKFIRQVFSKNTMYESIHTTLSSDAWKPNMYDDHVCKLTPEDINKHLYCFYYITNLSITTCAKSLITEKLGGDGTSPLTIVHKFNKIYDIVEMILDIESDLISTGKSSISE